MAKEQKYGSWSSSLTAEMLAKKSVRYGHMCVDGDALYWLESRASEKGRGVIVKRTLDGNLQDVLPTKISVRSKVHEYGSGDYIVDDEVVYFANGSDQCVYRFNEKLEKLEKLTTSDYSESSSSSEKDETKANEYRYADFAISADKNYLICVRESHFDEKGCKKVVNELVTISLSKKGIKNSVKVIHSGRDFYSFPRLSPNGNRLAWTSWDQPEMPWDAAELWVADFHKNGILDAPHKVTGGVLTDKKESIYQPEWSDDGVLHYISDASGWSNIYSCRDGLKNALTPIDREFGIPQWSLASSTYVITDDNHIYAVYVQDGQQYLCHIDESSGHIEPIELPIKDFGEHLKFSNNKLYFKGAGPSIAEAMYQYDLNTNELILVSNKSTFPLHINNISIAKAIEFEVTDCNSGLKRLCHGFYYQPKNNDYNAPENTQPPLIVMSHGGPTGMTTSSLNSAIQFWTHRGFARN